MSRDKQIEEMDAIIRGAVNGCSSYWSGLIANALLDEGYRKASEVAREIFGEIERVVGEKYNHFVFGNNDLDSLEQDAIINFSDEMSDCFAQLKKKYESEGADGV